MSHFAPALFDFLFDLDVHNSKPWFDANRERFEREVRGPMLAFVADFEAPLHRISKRYVADPGKRGGSMFRIHRNRRFQPDAPPYKTWAAAQFRHELGKDVHAPGFYLHLEPGNCFVGAGIWHPPSDVLGTLREAMVDDPRAWRRVRRKVADGPLAFDGDRLETAPRGYDRDHPLIEDLRRKDLILTAELTEDQVVADGFLDTYGELCRRAAPLNRWVCKALGLPM